MKSTQKKVKKVLERWKRNELSLIEAAQELCSLGYHPLDAWSILERT